LPVGQGVEIILRLHHSDRARPAHAARQSERGQQAKEDSASASHAGNPLENNRPIKIAVQLRVFMINKT
jgi:hypothetical protein